MSTCHRLLVLASLIALASFTATAQKRAGLMVT